jgi:hypothetical protein
MIQGGRYQRQGGEHFTINLEETQRNASNRESRNKKPVYPYFFEDIKTIGDHVHYAGNRGPHAANNRSDAAGGGHAHAGLMVYLGDSWPEQFRGKIFMNNIHGQRINMDETVRNGSGYIGKHGADFLNFNDRWSQVLNLLYDHDGSVYMIDWYDKNQCHHNDLNGHDKSNGRIFKVVYGQTKASKIDLQVKTDVELVELLTHRNEWQARHARRILQERGPKPAVHAALQESFTQAKNTQHRLRALWALHVTGGLNQAFALAQFKHSDELVRAWTIQLIAEDAAPSAAVLKEFGRLAREDQSPVVRLYLASALQRTAISQRAEILEGLVAHGEDAQDHNLPLMYWYATEPVVAQDSKAGLALITKSKIPLLRQYITRRMAASSKVAQAN